jgi:nucleoid-associated protein YgaU
MPEAEPQVLARRPRLGLMLILLAAAFLIGFIPQWWKARDQSAAREKAEKQLTITRMVKDLGSAAIDARRGMFEPARVSASAFFTAASFEVDQRDKSALTQQQRDGLAPLLAPRDEIITLLARSDGSAADKLVNLYVSARKALGT